MTNREKLISLLTEKDGKVRMFEIGIFLTKSPLIEDCKGVVNCGAYRCLKYISCTKCVTAWLNEEAKNG